MCVCIHRRRERQPRQGRGFRDWRLVLPEAVHALNNQREIAPGIAPSQVNRENFLALETSLNKDLWYPRGGRGKIPFRYHPGDIVTVKYASLKDQTVFGNKKSLTGFDSEHGLVIQARRHRPVGRTGAKQAPFYAGRPPTEGELNQLRQSGVLALRGSDPKPLVWSTAQEAGVWRHEKEFALLACHRRLSPLVAPRAPSHPPPPPPPPPPLLNTPSPSPSPPPPTMDLNLSPLPPSNPSPRRATPLPPPSPSPPPPPRPPRRQTASRAMIGILPVPPPAPSPPPPPPQQQQGERGGGQKKKRRQQRGQPVLPTRPPRRKAAAEALAAAGIVLPTPPFPLLIQQ